MKMYMLFLLGLSLTFTAAHAQSDAGSILNDEKLRGEILHDIVGSHELMMGLIGEVKKSDHAKMMIQHLLSVAADSAPDGDHAMMSEGHGHPADSAARSPYAGMESRSIKALSPEDIRRYLAGEGMGYAMAAELNHYPGPRHVLDDSAALELSEGQAGKIHRVYETMHLRAAELGKQIVNNEEHLDRLFAAREINEPQLKSSVGAIARLQGEVRIAHLHAHLATKSIITPQQAIRYDQLRGYRTPGTDPGNRDH